MKPRWSRAFPTRRPFARFGSRVPRCLTSLPRLAFTTMKLELEVPDSTLSALRQAPEEFAAGLRVMAAAKWYEVGALSQERAAELAGQSRQQFLLTLSRLGVSPFQGVDDELAIAGRVP